MVMRGAKRKGVRYFGPYSHAWAIRETLDLLLRVFPARTCSAGVFKRHGQIGRPCLLGDIGKCSAPCVGPGRAPSEHRRIVEDFCDFMAGRTDTHGAPPRAGDAGRLRRAGVRAGRPAARRPGGAAPGDGEAGGRASPTAPTPTWSPSPRTSSRPPCRSSTSAAGGSAASAAGWWRRPRNCPPGTLCTTSAPRSTAARPRSRRARPTCPREVLVPELPADAEALADWLSRAARGQGEPAGAAARRQEGPAWRPSPATPARR